MKRCTILLLGAGFGILSLPLPASAQSLDDVTKAALEHSPAVASALAQADAADARRDLAQAQRMPDVTLQGQAGIGRIDPRGFFGLAADSTVPLAAQLTAEMPLLTFGRIGGAVEQAGSGAKAARLMAAQTQLNLRVEVANAYTKALSANAMVERYDLLAVSLTELVRQAKLKFDVGAGTSTQVAQAQARLAESEAGLADAQGALATAKAMLTSLSGLDVVLDADLPAAPPTPETRDQAIDLALAANPALMAADQMVSAAQGQSRSVRAEALPTIGAYAEGSAVRDQFFPGYKADTASVGLRMKWNFLSFGRNDAKARGADAQLAAARADHANARLQTEQAAITAFEQLRTARAMVTATQARSQATKAALRGTRLEVEVGAQPQIALLDAQREMIEADAAEIQARGMVLVAAYQLRAITAMGQ